MKNKMLYPEMQLNLILDGLRNGEVVTVCAKPYSGLTTFAAELIYKNALTSKIVYIDDSIIFDKSLLLKTLEFKHLLEKYEFDTNVEYYESISKLDWIDGLVKNKDFLRIEKEFYDNVPDYFKNIISLNNSQLRMIPLHKPNIVIVDGIRDKIQFEYYKRLAKTFNFSVVILYNNYIFDDSNIRGVCNFKKFEHIKEIYNFSDTIIALERPISENVSNFKIYKHNQSPDGYEDIVRVTYSELTGYIAEI